MPTLLDKTKVLEAIRAQPFNNTSKAIFSAIASMGNLYPPCCNCDFYNKKEHHWGGYYGDVAFIATSDMRTFYCPVNDIKGWNDHPTEKGGE